MIRAAEQAAMTAEDIEVLANEVRSMLHQRTCCAGHAGEALLLVMASFALDDEGGDERRAAAMFRHSAERLARDIERGRFEARRTQ